MKQGKTLMQLAAEIERRSDAKADYIAPANKIAAAVERDGGAPVLTLDLTGAGQYRINEHAHSQLATYLDVPLRYYQRMLTDLPDLAASTVNAWLGTRPDDRRMVRTLDGQVRALLSDRYRTLENEDLAEAVLPVLADLNLMVLSCEITDRRMYIKAVDRDIAIDVPTGKHMGDGGHTFFDTCSPGIVISNSEVGSGALAIESSVFTRACTNLCLMGTQIRRQHVGGRMGVEEEVYALLTDETRRTTDAAIWGQVRDVTRAAFDEATFAATCKRLGQAAQDQITDDPVEVIERVGKRHGLLEGERTSVLQHLIRGGDLTRYGLHSAITRTAEDLPDYDRATELERLGGAVIDLDRRDWQQVAMVAQAA